MRRLPQLLLAVALIGGSTASAQVAGPPMGGSNQFIGPPSGTVQSFIGTWALTWDGPPDSGCPCQGKLVIAVDQDGADLDGLWQKKGANASLFGPVSYDQNVWAGRFAQPGDDLGYGVQGHFRLEVVDDQTLTGSYQREGMAIPFVWNAKRL
ncbi:hypothetical protein SAMN02745126_02414 [Enhydrobacter aerosaccus]|uniref:Lipocalin-like domain-containing protein n=1 Tax=Enhydrobacter aerosaccus TaxID=225324 RepID=A0A1T4NRI4_9HYPH|nr:hypothetical protein [Enhydrobacter aerosaccus]SJZ81873.1 hypothetical protein SAMN02745126_02414 [Enhydrobacter aerosaccus]